MGNFFCSTLLIGVLFLGCSQISRAQDPLYSQFFAAPLQLNPALTGLVDAPVFTFNYRNQWSQIPNGYATYAASYSQYVPPINSGFGALVEADVAGQGLYATYRVGLFYAYDIRFNKQFYIRMGLEANGINARLDQSQLVFLDQLSVGHPPMPSNEMPVAPSITYFDVGMGALVHTRYFYLGLGLKHLNTPQVAFTTHNEDGSTALPLRITVHIGSELALNPRKTNKGKNFVTPTALLMKQGDFYQLQFGGYLRHKIILGGIWFRHTFSNVDAVIWMLGIQKGIVKLTYSYDWTVSALGSVTGGSHEIALTFNLLNERRRYQNRYNDCLEIFR